MSLDFKGPKGVILAVILVAGGIYGYSSFKKGMATYSPPVTPNLTKSQIAEINASHDKLLAKLSGDPTTLLKEGKPLFDDNCESCHGEDGIGGTAPDLQGIRSAPITVAEKIFNGAGDRMPAFYKTMNEDQIAATAVYVESLKNTHSQKTKPSKP